ncbi:hypothetical protein ACTJKC_14720 [Pedobacter sp. 22226]|uniref:hypothetical protein n=1 Tax=Pedobacter sp. 22226 TaxID=3453894 RepID=UPI003F858966
MKTIKKLIFAGTVALSLATFASNSVSAQSKTLNSVSEKPVANTFGSEIEPGQVIGNTTGVQDRRGPGYWVQLFNVYLDVYLKYGYSASEAIDRAQASVYREIEIYYGVEL